MDAIFFEVKVVPKLFTCPVEIFFSRVSPVRMTKLYWALLLPPCVPNERERVVPYASVLTVWLKRTGRKFFTVIKATGHPEKQIGNRYYISSTEGEDLSRQYVTFVRVLHFHLRAKSRAYYVCGNNLRTILITAGFSIFAAFAISYTMENFHLNPVTSLIVSMLGIFVIALHGPLSKDVYPRKYSVAIFAFQLNWQSRAAIHFYNLYAMVFGKQHRT